MRKISLCLLSIFELSRCLGCLAIESTEPPTQASSTLELLEDTRHFRPLFFPSMHPNSLLAVFGSSIPEQPTPLWSASELKSHTEDLPGITISDTDFLEPTEDTPGDFSTSSWTAPAFFTDLSAFNITHFAAGRDNLEVVAGITLGVEDSVHADESTSWNHWTNASAMLQLFYPKDSINPARWPQGGSEFYAAPLDVSKAKNVTFEYKIFFPGDFEWVKGGKLPGLYGGHTGCSGGNAALDCFSTRLMWRAGGAGELYLYAPKDRQTFPLCNTPPLSVCDSTYGLSIGRGSFRFSRGAWTHVSQTVVLNTPGVQNGDFHLEVDGGVVIDRADVFYRDKPQELDSNPTPACDPNSDLDDGGGWLGSLLSGLFSTGFAPSSPCDTTDANAQAEPLLQEAALEDDEDTCSDDCPEVDDPDETDDPVGFQGMFFSTFFGGHHEDFATPKDQFVWFKDFALYINDP